MTMGIVEVATLAARVKLRAPEMMTSTLRRTNYPEAVTEAMNRVCEMVDTRPDPALEAVARRILEAVEW